MENMKKNNSITNLKKYIKSENVLGICLGLQLYLIVQLKKTYSGLKFIFQKSIKIKKLPYRLNKLIIKNNFKFFHGKYFYFQHTYKLYNHKNLDFVVIVFKKMKNLIIN